MVESDPFRALDAITSALDEAVSLDETRRLITFAARDLVVGADDASLTIRNVSTGELVTAAATSDVVRELDRLQYALAEGPCFASVTDEELVVVPDLSASSHWPRFAASAVALGMRSQLAARLRGNGVVAGLNLYARQPGVFVEPLDDVLAFVQQARIVLGYARENADLRRAIDRRTLVSEAVGIIMERYDVDERRAFRDLIKVSQETNTKLYDIAERIVRGSEGISGHRG